MRRLILAALLLSSCRPARKTIIEDEPPAALQSVHMGQPAHAGQLLAGFHAIEEGAWRWTGKRFAVVLRPPLRAGTNGGRLVFKFSYPEPVAAKLGTLTLQGTLDGHRLPAQSYSKADTYVYEQPIPAAWLQSESVRVAFELDKALPPAGAEHRELGLIASSISLRP